MNIIWRLLGIEVQNELDFKNMESIDIKIGKKQIRRQQHNYRQENGNGESSEEINTYFHS